MRVLVNSLHATFLQLFDVYTLEHKKTYKTDRPVNSAAISPLKPHVSTVCGMRMITRLVSLLESRKKMCKIKAHLNGLNSLSLAW